MKLFNLLLGLTLISAQRLRAETMTCQPASQKSTKLRTLAVDYVRGINNVATTQHAAAFIVVKFGNMYAAVDPAGTDISAVYILDDQMRVKTVLVST